MRLIVCGSRNYTDGPQLFRTMDRVLAEFERGDVHALEPGRPLVVHGDARGADRLAGAWARRERLDVEPMPADWQRGKQAGPQRNQAMLKPGAVLVCAFSISWPATTGTADMCRRASAARVPVLFVGPGGAEDLFWSFG